MRIPPFPLYSHEMVGKFFSQDWPLLITPKIVSNRLVMSQILPRMKYPQIPFYVKKNMVGELSPGPCHTVNDQMVTYVDGFRSSIPEEDSSDHGTFVPQVIQRGNSHSPPVVNFMELPILPHFVFLRNLHETSSKPPWKLMKPWRIHGVRNFSFKPPLSYGDFPAKFEDTGYA